MDFAELSLLYQVGIQVYVSRVIHRDCVGSGKFAKNGRELTGVVQGPYLTPYGRYMCADKAHTKRFSARMYVFARIQLIVYNTSIILLHKLFFLFIYIVFSVALNAQFFWRNEAVLCGIRLRQLVLYKNLRKLLCVKHDLCRINKRN